MRGSLRAPHGHCERTYYAVLALCYSLGMDSTTTRRTPDLDRALYAWESKRQVALDDAEVLRETAAELREAGSESDLAEALECEAEAIDLETRAWRWGRLQDATWRRMRRAA